MSHAPEKVQLDTSIRCSDSVEFEDQLRHRVVGQEEAVVKTTETVQNFMAGLNDVERPVGNLLLLGPTGTGKTHLCEAVADIMFGDPKSFIRIDCAEFQQSHETAKILGSPPGYVGHKEGGGQITQEKLDKTHNKEVKLSILLFDEIEKAHENFWELLLGILDKGRMTDSTGKEIDFTHTLIFMTSNLGAREVMSALEGGIGFSPDTHITGGRIQKISETAAAKRFSPEFMNRLDQVITFQYLTDEAMREILKIETGLIQKRILSSPNMAKFAFTCSDEVNNYLLKEGTSQKYGARYLKRTLEKLIVTPISNFLLTAQVELGDLIEIGLVDKHLSFYKVPAALIAEADNDGWKDFRKAVDE